jgi:hypothetical protein
MLIKKGFFKVFGRIEGAVFAPAKKRFPASFQDAFHPFGAGLFTLTRTASAFR